jgi:hypothetical protein
MEACWFGVAWKRKKEKSLMRLSVLFSSYWGVAPNPRIFKADEGLSRISFVDCLS